LTKTKKCCSEAFNFSWEAANFSWEIWSEHPVILAELLFRQLI